MNEKDIYRLLAGKFVSYKDLTGIVVLECGEKMVRLGPTVPYAALEQGIEQSPDSMYVRRPLIAMLDRAQEVLKTILAGHRLQVVYGYRRPAVQQQAFINVQRQLGLESDDLDEKTKEKIHHFVAVPEVAGHPTGGAVDVQVVAPSGLSIDMGTPVHAFVEDSAVFSPFISREAWHNRQLLRAAMITAGFAPFDGEWWHFSYGDREWACYYNKPHAFFDQIELVSKKCLTNNINEQRIVGGTLANKADYNSG